MKSRQSSDRIVMIAEQILRDSVSQSGIQKLNDIKKSLDVRSSKTRIKSHENSKDKNVRLSTSKKVPQSPKVLNDVRKRSVSKPDETYTRSYSRLSSVQNSESRTRKRSVRFSLQHQYPRQKTVNRRSPLKQQSNNHSQKTILKQSSLKKPVSPRNNTENALPTAKAISKHQNKLSMKKPTFQNFSAEHIVAKKLFGDEVKTKPKVENEISFNLNLNKLLRIVEKAIEAEKGRIENLSGGNKGSLLSQENSKLLKMIGKQLSTSKENFDLEENFKQKYSEKVLTPLKQRARQQNDFVKESRIQYTSEEIQGQQIGQNQIKIVDQSTKNQLRPKYANPHISESSNQQEEFSVTTQRYDSVHSVNQNGIKTICKDDRISKAQPNQNKILTEMSEKIEGLRNEKEWLVGTVESLLAENQQLKKLLVGTSLN